MPEEKKKTDIVDDKPGEAREAVEPDTGSVSEVVVEPKIFSAHDLAEYESPREDLPRLRPGDIVTVNYRVIEGGKERIQVFEGTIIGMKNRGISRTVTVRKTSFGIAVERIFPLNSKLVQTIVVKRHSKVRRAKLYFLRKRRGRAARLKELR